MDQCLQSFHKSKHPESTNQQAYHDPDSGESKGQDTMEFHRE